MLGELADHVLGDLVLSFLVTPSLVVRLLQLRVDLLNLLVVVASRPIRVDRVYSEAIQVDLLILQACGWVNHLDVLEVVVAMGYLECLLKRFDGVIGNGRLIRVASWVGQCLLLLLLELLLLLVRHANAILVELFELLDSDRTVTKV